MKDKGAVYRYTQSYKLQEMVSKNIGDVLCYLDSQEEDFMKSSEAVVSYLSNKQPQPLQVCKKKNLFTQINVSLCF